MSSLRITGGSLRGRRVPVPAGEVRPTSERARQAYFNIVADAVGGARFLDLFAGSGIFSFEALSRGAASATAVEKSRKSAAVMADAAASLGVELRAIAGDVLESFGRLAGPFDLVYADPPYAWAHYDVLLERLAALQLGADAIVAVEHRRRTDPFSSTPERLPFWRRAEYGEVWISFFRTSLPQKLHGEEVN